MDTLWVVVGLALLPALVGWMLLVARVWAWWQERRIERDEARRVARFNAELVALREMRYAHRKRARELRVVPRETSEAA